MEGKGKLTLLLPGDTFTKEMPLRVNMLSFSIENVLSMWSMSLPLTGFG